MAVIKSGVLCSCSISPDTRQQNTVVCVFVTVENFVKLVLGSDDNPITIIRETAFLLTTVAVKCCTIVQEIPFKMLAKVT